MSAKQVKIGQAKSVRRRTPTFPTRMASYWDFSPWGGGYLRRLHPVAGVGGIQLAEGRIGDIRTGEVYEDEGTTPS